MRFLRRHRFVLVFLGVVIICSILVVRQFLANQSAHIEMREDFILLQQKGHIKPTERLYQLLVQQLPNMSDMVLVDDLQRTLMLIDPKVQQVDNLVWKYHWAVKHHLDRRVERRVARLLKQIEAK